MAAARESLTYGIARIGEHRVERLMSEVIARAMTPSVELMIEEANTDAERRLAEEEGQRLRFERRLYLRWGEALDLVRLFRLWCLQAGTAFHDRRRPTAGDWVHEALVRLHARSCLVAAEVIALLEAGLASGAHARWRSAHEIAVIAFFLRQHGQDAAERYLLHDAVESHRSVADYQRYATRLNYEPFAAAEVDEIQAVRDELVTRFGRDYGSQYGWAAAALGKPRPTFRDIEAAVSLDHLRPYYRMASHPTHAGPKGLAFDMGLLSNSVMLAGPSNAGLADPGHGIAISLLHNTVTLLNHDPDMGDVVTMMFLLNASDAVGDAFLRASRKLDAEDADIAGWEPSN
jgi:hypothetical protein